MTLEQRVRKLERENRRMRRIAAVAVAVVAVVVLVGQGKEEKLPDLVVRSLTVKADSASKTEAKLTGTSLVFRKDRKQVARFGPSYDELQGTKCKYYYDRAHFWELYKKKLPDSLKEMEAPLKAGEPDFIKIEPDPWGSEYVLEREGRRIRVRSPGPDKTLHTSDDVVYPPTRR
jgi:hypothetical protein